MALHETIADGVATVVMDNPPVNALGIADTYALADLLDGYGNRADVRSCLLYTSPSPRDGLLSRMPSSA